MPSSFEQTARVCALVTVFGGVTAAVGAESIEFVGEHLSEIAMDNRYATLPLWNECNRARGRDSCASYSAGYALTHSGTLSIDGPMLAASFIHPVGKRAKLSAFMFFDNLALAGGNERRPLDVLFANPPLALPAGAQFTGLDGSARHFGGGLAFNRTADLHWRPRLEWTAGLLWERVALRDYAFDYHILDGPDTGFRGTLDYSTNYTHVTPFVGAGWFRSRGAWGLTPHFQLAIPLPRRGIAGRITGPDFDLAGNTDTNGRGKHFGDPSLTLGLDFTYLPWGLTIDLGSTLSQSALEPFIHEGVRHNWLLSLRWLR